MWVPFSLGAIAGALVAAGQFISYRKSNGVAVMGVFATMSAGGIYFAERGTGEQAFIMLYALAFAVGLGAGSTYFSCGAKSFRENDWALGLFFCILPLSLPFFARDIFIARACWILAAPLFLSAALLPKEVAKPKGGPKHPQVAWAALVVSLSFSGAMAIVGWLLVMSLI